MAVELYYTFNNSNSKDYSGNGIDGTDTSITYSAGDIGFNAVFNADNDSVDVGTFTALNGLTEVSLYFRAKFLTTTGTNYVFYKNSQFYATFDGTTLSVSIIGVSGTATVDFTPTLNTYYAIHVSYLHNGFADDMSIYVDGILEDSTTTQGALTTNSNNLYLGGNSGGGIDSARFEMNEFKVMSDNINTVQINSHIQNPNGLIIGQQKNLYALGDILCCNENQTNKGYAVVTFVDDNDVRIQPLNAYVQNGLMFNRVGNFWDSTRQYYFLVSDDGIRFYNGVSLSSEAFTDAKLVKADTITSNTVLDYGTLTGGINNYDIPDNNFISINAGSFASITGIAAQSYPRRVVLINRHASNTIRLYDNSGSSSTENRFDLVADYDIPANKSVEIFYDTLAARWRLIKE